MNTAQAYKKATDRAQAWVGEIAGDGDFDKIDIDKMKASAEHAAHAASMWAADASALAAARAGAAAHKAGEWLEQASETATDWLEDESARAIAMLPAMKAVRRARRRRWVIGSAIAIAIIFYFYDPDRGRERRAKLVGMFKKSEPTATNSPSFSTQTVNEARSEIERENAVD